MFHSLSEPESGIVGDRAARAIHVRERAQPRTCLWPREQRLIRGKNCRNMYLGSTCRVAHMMTSRAAVCDDTPQLVRNRNALRCTHTHTHTHTRESPVAASTAVMSASEGGCPTGAARPPRSSSALSSSDKAACSGHKQQIGSTTNHASLQTQE
eukprot:1157902-Pelagomonas_calceolata.AAC.9